MATVNKQKCEFCSKKFIAKRSGAKTCSPKCRHNLWYRKKKEDKEQKECA